MRDVRPKYDERLVTSTSQNWKRFHQRPRDVGVDAAELVIDFHAQICQILQSTFRL